MTRSFRLPATLLGLGVAVGVVAALATAPTSAHVGPGAHSAPAARAAFQGAMRMLWEDHITWTRLYIVSAATGETDLPDLGATADRLFRNQVDIGNAIRPFYGAAAGDELTSLLREHIRVAAELIAEAKAGDQRAVADATARWYANGDEIASFLSAANPEEWRLAEMRAMMRSHLDLTLEQAVARLEGRYPDDVAGYDRIHAQILEMADMLSSGIIRQFPGRFGG